ncbi:5-oxoprolinase subunit PxpA [Aliiglaciecola sp. M165]|uniref:5-oxoprolinase subunit PxpA n=1 Tax=Aliiglaciecola sp. M165 TaxID=2593649 RepID=UPI0028C50344|nr:5-oxoprolinase subunit PxpA [Aliiglaciecola sp. M165]
MIKLNCDLGESFGNWQIANDASIMAHIDMANIACGFHAGDPLVMQTTIEQAVAHNVTIGAHPSYPDLQGFGRRSMSIPERELIPILHYQIAALDGMSKTKGGKVAYVKPHGALYNDMVANVDVFESVVKAVSEYDSSLPVVVQALPNTKDMEFMAEKYGISLWFEGFADRSYLTNGKLTPRSHEGALLSLAQSIQQVDSMLKNQCVTSVSGETVPLRIDTLCVHGDSSDSLDAVMHIREILGS